MKKLTADRDDLHTRLRLILADNRPRTFSELRVQFDISPVLLLEEIERFPLVWDAGHDGKHPTVRLREDAPIAKDVLDRAAILEAIDRASASGIYLAVLHRRTGLVSKRIEELLKGVAGIERFSRNKKILYRRQIAVSPPAQSQPVDSSATLDRLVELVGSSTRHLSWLENFLDRADIMRVIDQNPDLFESEPVDLGQPDRLVRLKRQPEPVHEQNEPEKSPIQDYVSSGPGEVPSDEYAKLIKECGFRPASPGMCSRRGGAIMRGDRHRTRKPLVKI